jgi:hypothetical protein
MYERYIHSSLTRISDLQTKPFEVAPQVRTDWSTGDYVVGAVTDTSGYREIELPSGRNMEVAAGDVVVGALGERQATLEITGSWTDIGDDRVMHALTRAGLFGRQNSRSTLVSRPLELRYQGHVVRNGTPVTMGDFVPDPPDRTFDVPTVLLVGTSMSAGKTTAGRIVTRRLTGLGGSVLGAKLSGAGRYRDVLSLYDAGASWIFDFVDAGLPSTIGPAAAFRSALRGLLARMAEPDADVAVIEVGASPLEPYNGDVVIEALQDTVALTILCASDPYAVLGVQKAFSTLDPDLVTGIATNTAAGIALLDRLTHLPAFNIRDAATHGRLDALLRDRLALS